MNGPETHDAAGAAEAFSIEAALARLEAIADDLEGGDLDLEHSLARFREARELYALCVARLSAAEHEVQLLMADGTLDRIVDQDDAFGATGEETR